MGLFDVLVISLVVWAWIYSLRTLTYGLGAAAFVLAFGLAICAISDWSVSLMSVLHSS